MTTRKRYSNRYDRCFLKTGYTLVITEKPKAARRVADAIGASKMCRQGKAMYYVDPSGSIVVASAVGHLFGLYTPTRGYPVYDYKWYPLHEIDRSTSFQKPYYNLIKQLARRAGLFVNACDYDIEGSVIGYLIIKFLGDDKKAKRMKYSTLTLSELRKAWRNLSPLDWEMVEAGLARHEVDWLWGINISRALMDHAKRSTGRKVILSAGRVQSPTLVKAYLDWVERGLHVPEPMFIISLTLEKDSSRFQAVFDESPSTRKEALKIASDVREQGKVRVVYLTRKPYERKPPPPFNLPDLQAEAARIYGYTPSYTQKLAEDLYLAAAISYPRTNSQKLPPSLDYKGIIRSIGKQEEYREFSIKLLDKPVLTPRQGQKDDPAHPAIYPTGIYPKGLTVRHMRIYDLIVRRFLASFSDTAILVKSTVILTDLKGLYRFRSQGTYYTVRGWTVIYPFSDPDETFLPELAPGEIINVVNVSVKTDWSQPRTRPVKKINLVKWMESVKIGTEATRARIVETLYRRGYLKETSKGDEPTRLGIGIARLIIRAFPQLSSPDLTRKLEENLEAIRLGVKDKTLVVSEAKKIVTDLVERYREIIESESSRNLAEEAGFVQPKIKCQLCDLPASENVYGVPLCDLHAKAFRKLVSSIGELEYKLGYSRSSVLSKIRDKGGHLVSDVVRMVLENPSLLRKGGYGNSMSET